MKKELEKNIESHIKQYRHTCECFVGIINNDSDIVKHLNKALELVEVMHQVTFELENKIIDFCNLINGDNLDEVNLNNYKEEESKNIYTQKLLEDIADKMKFIILDLMDQTGLIRASMIDRLEEKYDYLKNACLRGE